MATDLDGLVDADRGLISRRIFIERDIYAGARVFGPGGTFEQDDMDNWQAGRGVVARRYPLNYEMGAGRERFDPALGALASDYRFSESNHRGFYRHWARLMRGASWEAAN